MTQPTNTSFAEEIKSDRLKLLNFFSMTVSAVIMIGLLTFGTLSNIDANVNFALIVGVGLIIAGSSLSNYLLSRSPFTVSAWIFILTPMLAMGFMMMQLGEDSLSILPFVFPLIVFIGGLLVAPISTLYLTIISIVIILGAPYLATDTFSISTTQIFSIILIGLAAGLAALVTGELYQVTQWSLDNYNRERRTNDELFEKRDALQKSLLRAEILGEKIQETNASLELANAEAEEAKHFRGQFLANMSHELRTPLNAIIGFSETMLQFPIMYDDEPLPDAYERDLSQIYNSGRQLLHVINDILDLAKVDAGKLEIHLQEVEAGAIVNAVMSTAKGLLGTKPVKLHASLLDPMPHVWADETRLRQVLLNIYSNACKYTDEGSITLTVTELDNNEIQFAIADTGVGIDPEFHDKLFEEFQQAKAGGRDPRSGSGLGLAISKELLDLMGGRIWMESTVGEGTTFYFTIQKYNQQGIKDVTLDDKNAIEAQGITESTTPRINSGA
ncbi:MAG: ATP-binding protein [Phototrophicaceae bacterium]